MNKTATIEISRSSHPEFDFFADFRDTTAGANRQLGAMRGSRTEVDEWAAQATEISKIHNVTLTVVDLT